MTYLSNLRLDTDNRSGDAFGRLRVTLPTTRFDSKLIGVDDAPLHWDESLESGAGITASTPTVAKPYIDFTSTLNTAGQFTRQTYRRFVYTPGKSQQILMTGVLDLSGGGTGVERRIGYFDDNNGCFFEDDAGTIGVTTRSNDTGSPVDTTVAQASWDDPMDGTGASGITVDWTKAQIFVLDFQWLSIGRVRFGLQIDGVLHYVHTVSQANTGTVPWASTPNLPVRYQMITTGSSPASTMRCICCTVLSEGGSLPDGQQRYYSTAGTQVDMDTEDQLYAVAGIRLKSTHLGTDVEIQKVQVQLQSSSDTVEWVLIYGNPTLGGSEAWTGLTNSSVETLDVGSATTVSGGTQVDGGYVATGTAPPEAVTNVEIQGANSLRLGAAIDGTATEYILAARPINGSSTDVRVEGAMTWRETL